MFRFAPSPNGFLHLGHAYSALLNQRLAIRDAGRLLLRLEDIDGARCTPALARAIEEDLTWLGVTWSPPVLRQSERMPLYRAALGELAARELAYPCFCTRGDIARSTGGDWPRDPDGSPLYPGTCRGLGEPERRYRIVAGEPAAWRLDLARATTAIAAAVTWDECGESSDATTIGAEPERWGDVLLARKDIGTSYHLAVVVDDAAQGITDVVRGVDLFASTSVHRMLQGLLGLPAPRYHHHRLICDETGAKLAKSAQSLSLRAMRERGLTAASIRERLGLRDT